MSDNNWGGIADEYNQDSSETSKTKGTSETTTVPETAEVRETAETNETTGTAETSESSEASKTNIREEWNGRTIYLDDGLVKDVDLRFDELALEAKRDDKQIGKNRDFYPAVFRAALNETSIEEELGLED